MSRRRGAFAIACSAYAADPGGYPALCNDTYDNGKEQRLTQCTINGKKHCEVTCRTGENVRTCRRLLGFGYLDAIAGKTCDDFPAPTSNETAAAQ